MVAASCRQKSIHFKFNPSMIGVIGGSGLYQLEGLENLEELSLIHI